MLNLCLHCGGRNASRPKVADVPTPSATATWNPIPHNRLISLVERTVEGHGYNIAQSALGSSPIWRAFSPF